jgi:hypothetical protein
MNPNVGKLALGAAILVFSALLSVLLPAQDASAALTGTLTSQSGAAVPNAKISVKNLVTGQAAETGLFNVPNLTPGDYDVSASADGFPTQCDDYARNQANVKFDLGRSSFVK